MDLGDIDRAQASLEEAGRKGVALESRSISTAVSTEPASSPFVSIGEMEYVGIANLRSGEAEDRAANLRLLRSYITDQRGRKFYHEYAAPVWRPSSNTPGGLVSCPPRRPSRTPYSQYVPLIEAAGIRICKSSLLAEDTCSAIS
jgi:hypothetical protein